MHVATVPTACGIETKSIACPTYCIAIVATVPTACGIETLYYHLLSCNRLEVATVPTACGIETRNLRRNNRKSLMLQQYLPLAVLKRRHLSC